MRGKKKQKTEDAINGREDEDGKEERRKGEKRWRRGMQVSHKTCGHSQQPLVSSLVTVTGKRTDLLRKRMYCSNVSANKHTHTHAHTHDHLD